MRQHKNPVLGLAASAKPASCCRRWSLRVCFCLVFWCAWPCSVRAQAQLEGNDIPAITARTVLGIVSYARWPVQPEVYRFCIMGDPANVRSLSEHSSQVAGREFRLKSAITDDDHWISDCDILYLGAMAASERLSILKKIKQETILTIGEGDEMCDDGMMFCLGSNGQNAVLHANLDAIARSGIKINANVLLLLRHRDRQP